MRIRHRHGAGIAAIGVSGLLVASVLAASMTAQDKPPASGKPQRDPIVTPVTGPSWLNILGVRYSDTTLGRSAATYASPPAERGAPATPLPLAVGQPVVLSGADLYRLNCQACHRAEGVGSPPEIKAVLGFVQGTSLAIVRQQLQRQGRADAQSAARAQSAKARIELHNRVRKGGQRMPPLAHLQDADFDSLYAYLTQLAGTPDAAPQTRRSVSWSRLGEHVIKGTCHICHDAVGPRPTDLARAQGTIPPFSVLLEDKPVVDFLTKVRTGGTVTSGEPAFHYRGRMPIFPHIRDLEIAAAYAFLVEYPPQGGSPSR